MHQDQMLVHQQTVTEDWLVPGRSKNISVNKLAIGNNANICLLCLSGMPVNQLSLVLYSLKCMTTLN